MSTNINSNLLKAFITTKIGGDTMDKREAKTLKVGEDLFDEADVDESNDLDIDEILDNDDTYELFASMYVEENEQKTAKDEEEEKRRPVTGGSNNGKA